MAKDTGLNSDGYVYGGEDAAAEYMGLPDTFKKADGSWDFAAASDAAILANIAGKGETSGELQFGGVGNLPISIVGEDKSIPEVINPEVPVDTDLAGGLPDIITNPPVEDPFVQPLPDPSGPSDAGGWGQTPAGDPFVPPYMGTTDTSWDWGQGPVAGEYFGAPPTFNAQTMPGQDSPWGVPNTPGGNQDFYRQQFSNLLSGQNAFDKAQVTSAMIRQQAQEAGPGAPTDMNKFWADRGVDPAQAVQGGADSPYTWNRLEGIESGMTNKAITDLLASRGVLNEAQAGIFQNHWDNPETNPEGTYWSSDRFQTPTDFNTSFGDSLSPGFLDAMTTVGNAMWTRGDLTTPPGGGPTAVPGYALPVGAGG